MLAWHYLYDGWPLLLHYALKHKGITCRMCVDESHPVLGRYFKLAPACLTPAGERTFFSDWQNPIDENIGLLQKLEATRRDFALQRHAHQLESVVSELR